MRMRIVLEAELEHSSGLFESRDSLEGQVLEAVEGADYGSWEGDNGGVYDTAEWEVSVDAG